MDNFKNNKMKVIGKGQKLSWIKSLFMMVRDPQSSKWKKALAILGFIYIVSPMDLIPELPFGLPGLIDDGIVLLTTVSTIVANLNKYRNNYQNYKKKSKDITM